MIVPQMTLITPVPIDRVGRQRPVEKTKPVFGQVGQPPVVYFQRCVEMGEQFFEDCAKGPDRLLGGLRRFSIRVCPSRRQSRPGAVEAVLRAPKRPISQLLPAQITNSP